MAAKATAGLTIAQAVVEYGLILAAIAIVIVLGAIYFGDTLMNWLSTMLARVTTS